MTSANAAGLIRLLLRQSDRHPIRSIGAADLQAYEPRIVRSLRNLGILTEREDLRDDGATVFQVVDDALVVVDPETGATRIEYRRDGRRIGHEDPEAGMSVVE